MSNQKNEKPTLSGQRIKTRKRDEKEKYDPTAFRDSIQDGINKSQGNLEEICKFLDVAGGKLDYRRYNEPLLDILFAGGILAPGGSIVGDGEGEDGTKVERAETCVFTADDTFEGLKAQYGVFYKLIRRYKYLEKPFSEELKKLIVFLKGFELDQRRKLGMIYGIFFGNGFGSALCLNQLFDDHLVKEGLALEFATNMFKFWLKEKDIASIASVLKRVGLEGKLSYLLPINKRTTENFENHFKEAGLHQIVEYQRSKATADQRKELQKQVEEMIKENEPVKEMIQIVKDEMKRSSIPEHDVVIMVWLTIMNSVEWNKKDDLVGDQALKHLKIYVHLLAALTQSGRSEMGLIQKVQTYCYENMNFMKSFQKIIVLFYKTDVVSEEAILKWYKEGHLDKGKSVFLEQMKSFVEWLENAEEESDEED